MTGGKLAGSEQDVGETAEKVAGTAADKEGRGSGSSCSRLLRSTCDR